ncbi:hypothetical protein BDZ45DRAFT_741358 [Acephala macrosclerotiorum]|nr:hypothetical protein BDZ45DRAFT_741358 [Acephala macrosclerotiorum]
MSPFDKSQAQDEDTTLAAMNTKQAGQWQQKGRRFSCSNAVPTAEVPLSTYLKTGNESIEGTTLENDVPRKEVVPKVGDVLDEEETKALTSFTPFPRLPFELHLGLDANSITYTALETCHESRAEYIETNPKFLPASCRKGRIYYNPEKIIIYIQHWHILHNDSGSTELPKAIEDNHQLQNWFSEIKLLAVDFNKFDCLEFRAERFSGLGGNADVHSMHIFKNLKRWIGITFESSRGPGEWSHFVWSYRRGFREVRKALKESEAANRVRGPSYKAGSTASDLPAIPRLSQVRLGLEGHFRSASSTSSSSVLFRKFTQPPTFPRRNSFLCNFSTSLMVINRMEDQPRRNTVTMYLEFGGELKALMAATLASDNNVPQKDTISTFDWFCESASALDSDDDENDSHHESMQATSTFHPFPTLPYELREQIWHLTLPSKLRMLRVRVRFVPKDSKDPEKPSTMVLEFRVTPDTQATNPLCVDKSALAISNVCHESRDAYLDRNPNILPAANGAIIRYNANETIVNIRNYDYFVMNADSSWFWDILYRQQCLKRIKMLALPSTWVSEQIDDRYPVLAQFMQLETLIAATNVKDRATYHRRFSPGCNFLLQKDRRTLQKYTDKQFRFRDSAAPTVVMMCKQGFFDERAYRGEESWDLEEVL